MKAKIIIITTILLLTITLFLSCCYIYTNLYWTSTTKDDINFQYTVYNDQLTIKITPRYNIKNLKYEISFRNGNKTITKGNEYIEANKTVIYKHNVSDIERNYIKNQNGFKMKSNRKKNQNDSIVVSWHIYFGYVYVVKLPREMFQPWVAIEVL